MIKKEIEYLPLIGAWKNFDGEVIYVQSCYSQGNCERYSREILKVKAKNLSTGRNLKLKASDFLSFKRLDEDDALEIDYFMNIWSNSTSGSIVSGSKSQRDILFQDYPRAHLMRKSMTEELNLDIFSSKYH